MPASRKDETVNTTVRLPKWLVEAVDDLAVSEHRSRNSMIRVLLERAVKPQ